MKASVNIILNPQNLKIQEKANCCKGKLQSLPGIFS